jgi:hypothetical protein
MGALRPPHPRNQPAFAVSEAELVDASGFQIRLAGVRRTAESQDVRDLRLRYLSISPTYRATATTRDIVCG